MSSIPQSIARKFYAKVNRKGPIHPVLRSRCWVWTAGTIEGYGWFGGPDGNVRAHAFGLRLTGVTIPKGSLVCHRCNNRLCVRPSHLYVGDHKSNKDDSMRACTHVHGDRHPRARLTSKKVLAIRRGYWRPEETVCTLAIKHGVSTRTISAILRGDSWSHVGGPRARNGRRVE